MLHRKKTSTKAPLPKDKLLPKLTLKFFSMPRITAALWILVTLFGILSYTTLLRREGFPSIEIPVVIVTGTYPVNDPAKVDKDIGEPLSRVASKQADTSVVLIQSTDNFVTMSLQYKESVNAKDAADSLKKAVEQANLPASFQPSYSVPYFGATGGDIEQINLALSFYAKDGAGDRETLANNAKKFADALEAKHLSLVKSTSTKDPYSEVTDPATGQTATIQRTFDRFGNRPEDNTTYRPSILVTVAAVDNVDVIKLDTQVREAVHDILQQPAFKPYNAEVSASFAPAIEENITELQTVLLEGLLAVLVVGSIVIAIRASLITVLSMVTVILGAIGVLYLLGYTLNVITLFGLILGLSLIVDDTIIMVEAIDAARRRTKTPREAVQQATRKVSRAMVAATTTAALCFLPLAFVGGILGSFIRAIPVTIISALLISLTVALIFIPFFARFLLLGKKQMGKEGVREIAAGVEEAIAGFIVKPMLWARNSRKRIISVGLAALVFGFLFIGAGGWLAGKVTFNIFPPSKDTNGLVITMAYPAGTTVQSAEKIAEKVEAITAKTVSSNFIESSYYDSGTAQQSMMQIELVPYTKRNVTSVQLVDKLNTQFASFKEAQVIAAQVDLGPPSAAFNVQIDSTNRKAAYALATDMEQFLNTTTLTRISGEEAHFTNVNVSSPDQYIRFNNQAVVQVQTGFDGTDTTTLVTLAKDAVDKHYTPAKLAEFGLPKDAISYNLGQEQENQDSFKTLAVTFPLLLVVIFLLLALQFRSLLQPVLIFMAIPFSIFGVMLGLYLTKNSISFFAALGFFALIGLSIKNTILLTDFANQARAAGNSAVDSAAAAIRERFRPLIATSITAVVSLIPLAVTSPFWQGLAVVLIFGLTSSTLLVLLVFPYYYLGAEFLRLHISRKLFALWLVVTGVAVYGLSMVNSPAVAAGVFALSLLGLIIWALSRHRETYKQT